MSAFNTPPIQWEQIENTLHDWFSKYADVIAIWGSQDAPQPAYPYGTLEIIDGPHALGSMAEQQIEIDDPENKVTTRYFRQLQFTVRGEVHACPNTAGTITEARRRLSEAQAALELPQVHEVMFAAGIVLEDEGTIQTVNFTLEDTWINRCVLDLTFRVVSHIAVETEGTIDGLEVTWDNVDTFTLSRDE